MLKPATLRSLAKKVFVGIPSGLFLLIGGQFVLAICEERGFFSNPTQKVGRVMSGTLDALTFIVHHPAFPWVAAGLIGASAGFFAGVWADAIARRDSQAGALISTVAPTLAPSVASPESAADRRAASIKAAIAQWRKASSYELYQIAALWVDELPPTNYLLPLSDAADACLARFLAAITTGEIVPEPSTSPFAITALKAKAGDRQSRVSREKLMAFAAKHGESPAFLASDNEEVPSPALLREWMAPKEAIKRLLNPFYEQAVTRATYAREVAERLIKNETGALAQYNANQSLDLEGLRNAERAAQEAAAKRLDQLLESGALVAKGLKARQDHLVAEEDSDIPAAYFRVNRINPLTDAAGGPGISYVGVRIAVVNPEAAKQMPR